MAKNQSRTRANWAPNPLGNSAPAPGFQATERSPEIWDAEAYDVSRASLERFAEAAAGGPSYIIPLDEMIHGAAVTEAIVRAAASGKTEKVA